ncbi:cyclopropane-fatty-acyl-phospholipid synthase family protein [Sphingomonas molluscorum]|uniref:cyclopropane-fatty-acyl-phospholipid synthase family protein n=1 Tax=Sphingomonas molluscorum TaxID=418184 RepID=UPI0031D5AFE4
MTLCSVQSDQEARLNSTYVHPGRALSLLLDRILTQGNLAFVDGTSHELRHFGDGTGPEVVIGLTPGAARRIAANPDLALGEAFVDGTLVLMRGTLAEFFALLFRNQAALALSQSNMSNVALRLKRRFQQANARLRARRNVEHHYDLSNELYRLFLDRDLQYSCAYYADPGMTLEDAQRAKKRHLISKLLLEPGQRVLDIGCGWGGMALEVAAAERVSVLGVTLSVEQLDVARKRATMSNARFELTDYRDVEGRFDRIVSVGMFEHVGVPNYDAFFRKVAELLTDDGVAVIHSIGRKDGPDITNPWIEKYIFPGGYIPALSEVLPAIERAGLWVTDIEILRLHYAETLLEWQRRFHAHRDQIAQLYDERFCRMWDFYLAASESAFRHQGHMNFQIQLARRVDVVPLTRDYITDNDRAAADTVAAAA